MMESLVWFLPWCWGVNMSFDLLIRAGRSFPWIAQHNTPIDGGLELSDGYRLLGDSTTWLGLLQATILGIIGELLIQGHYFFILALLVWCGHAAGSFIKRRLGMARGRFLPGVDHIDYVVVAGMFLYAVGTLSFAAVLLSVVLTLVLTPAITGIGFFLSIRTRPL